MQAERLCGRNKAFMITFVTAGSPLKPMQGRPEFGLRGKFRNVSNLKPTTHVDAQPQHQFALFQ